MKKTLALSMLLLASAMLASCGGATPSSSSVAPIESSEPEESSKSEEEAKFVAYQSSYNVFLGTELDYVNVTSGYPDSVEIKSGKDFVVTSGISNHNITGKAVGQAVVTYISGSQSFDVTINVIDEGTFVADTSRYAECRGTLTFQTGKTLSASWPAQRIEYTTSTVSYVRTLAAFEGTGSYEVASSARYLSPVTWNDQAEGSQEILHYSQIYVTYTEISGKYKLTMSASVIAEEKTEAGKPTYFSFNFLLQD